LSPDRIEVVVIGADVNGAICPDCRRRKDDAACRVRPIGGAGRRIDRIDVFIRRPYVNRSV